MNFAGLYTSTITPTIAPPPFRAATVRERSPFTPTTPTPGGPR